MTARTLALIAPLLGTGLLLSACGSHESNASTSLEGREETRNIRNTQAIGYSGEAIADQIDAALDANDARNERLRDVD